MKIIRWLKNRIGRGNESGVTLVEAMIAILLLGGGVVAMVLSMSGGALAVGENSEEVVAQGLARTQLEYVKQYAYDPDASTYPSVSAPEGYIVSVAVAAVPDTNNNIQKITATVTRDGDTVLAVQDYKVNR